MLHILFKVLGAALVVCAGALLGYKKGETVMRRVQVLEEMAVFLSAVRSGLRFRGDRTEELLRAAQCESSLQVLPLYFDALSPGSALHETLESALIRTRRELTPFTTQAEQQLFCTSIAELGGCTGEEAQQKLSYAQVQLELSLGPARIGAQQQKKLYRTMGVSLGAAAALLLL